MRVFGYIYIYFVLGFAGWSLHAGLEDSVLIHNLLHQFLLLPTQLAQLLPEEKHVKRQLRRRVPFIRRMRSLSVEVSLL